MLEAPTAGACYWRQGRLRGSWFPDNSLISAKANELGRQRPSFFVARIDSMTTTPDRRDRSTRIATTSAPTPHGQSEHERVFAPVFYIVNAESIVFLRGFRSHARQSVGESQEHPRSGERRLRLAAASPR